MVCDANPVDQPDRLRPFDRTVVNHRQIDLVYSQAVDFPNDFADHHVAETVP